MMCGGMLAVVVMSLYNIMHVSVVSLHVLVHCSVGSCS